VYIPVHVEGVESMGFQDKLIEGYGIANFMLFLYEHVSEEEYNRLMDLQREYFEHADD